MFIYIRYFVVLLLSFLIIGCKGDTPNQNSSNFDASTDQIELSTEIEERDFDPKYSKTNPSTIDFKVDEIAKPEEVKVVIEKAAEVAKDNVEKSENKGKSCDEIIEELDALITEIIKDKSNKSLMKQLAKWNTDVLHNNCRKDPDYEASFLKIISKLN